ncbi:hypothetical protein WJX77_004708 [Trebouxia sp. C0004]
MTTPGKLLGAPEDAQGSNELPAVNCDSIKGEVTLTKVDNIRPGCIKINVWSKDLPPAEMLPPKPCLH